MKFISILAFSFISLISQAQTIFGKITDHDDEGLDLAVVLLLSTTDSSFVKSEYTDVDGSYELNSVVDGDYILQISMLGFKDFYKNITMSTDIILLDPISLEQESQIMQEIEVIAKVSFVERKLDRVISILRA